MSGGRRDVTSLGGNQARMNEQNSGQSWRLLQLAVKYALCDHSQLMLAFSERFAHNCGPRPGVRSRL
jgi:hypothetical protein